EIRQARATLLGSIIETMPCPRCQGRGEVVDTVCKECKGQTQVRKQVKQRINIPGGIPDEGRVRILSQGEPGFNGGPNGNLWIFVRVMPHEYFSRRENDILLDMKINVAQAALGATITVPTVEGDESLIIPPGTQSGKIFRVRSKGFPKLNTNGLRGDQLIVVQVVVPT